MKASITIAVGCVLLLISLDQLSANQICPDNSIPCDINDHLYVETKVAGDEIDLSWKFNESLSISGFRSIIYKSDESVQYQSPLLQMSERSMQINQALNSGENKICVQVVVNDTVVLIEKCEVMKVTDLKIIVGVLAGTIFLIPCIIGLVYILYKDKQITSQEQEPLVQDSGKEEMIKGHGRASKILKPKVMGAHLAQENSSYIDETDSANRKTAETNGKGMQDVLQRPETKKTTKDSAKHSKATPDYVERKTGPSDIKDSDLSDKNDNSNMDKPNGAIFTIRL